MILENFENIRPWDQREQGLKVNCITCGKKERATSIVIFETSGIDAHDHLSAMIRAATHEVLYPDHKILIMKLTKML